MIAQFSLRLLLGLALTWAVLPRRQITSGFFRIQCLLALALCALAAVSAGELVSAVAPPRPAAVHEATDKAASSGDATAAAPGISTGFLAAACAALAACAFAGSVAWTLERRAGGTAFLAALLLGAAALLVGVAIRGGGGSPGEAAHRALGELAAGGVLGSCVAGMLLGHWYLTAPTMSIAPLGRANLWFGATLMARAALSAWGLWVCRGVVFGAAETISSDGQALHAARLDTTHAVWLLLRWIAGIVLPLILCVMTARILRYRNTQSATGVLFAAVILVFLGELAGALVSRELGVPL